MRGGTQVIIEEILQHMYIDTFSVCILLYTVNISSVRSIHNIFQRPLIESSIDDF